MSAAARINDDLRDWIAMIAGPRDWNDTRESWLAKAARRLDFPSRRVRALFYGEARRIDAAEYLTIKARAQAIAQNRLEAAIHEQQQALVALGADIGVAMAGGQVAGAVGLGGAQGAPPDDGAVA